MEVPPRHRDEKGVGVRDRILLLRGSRAESLMGMPLDGTIMTFEFINPRDYEAIKTSTAGEVYVIRIPERGRTGSET
jgi:hypothetical protein